MWQPDRVDQVDRDGCSKGRLDPDDYIVGPDYRDCGHEDFYIFARLADLEQTLVP